MKPAGDQDSWAAGRGPSGVASSLRAPDAARIRWLRRGRYRRVSASDGDGVERAPRNFRCRRSGCRDLPAAVRLNDRGARPETAAAHMTNSDWWARAKLPPRLQTIEIRKRERLCTLCKGDHAGKVARLRGAELILSINGHWRRIRVFTEHESQLSTAIVSTVAKLEPRG